MSNLPEGYIEDDTCEELEAAEEWYLKHFGLEAPTPQKALDEYIKYYEEERERKYEKPNN